MQKDELIQLVNRLKKDKTKIEYLSIVVNHKDDPTLSMTRERRLYLNGICKYKFSKNVNKPFHVSCFLSTSLESTIESMFKYDSFQNLYISSYCIISNPENT